MPNNTPADFTTTVSGKWILTGEHAVLRGHPALIFPIKAKQLTLEFWSSNEEVRAEFHGDFADEIQFLFWSALERATEILDLHRSDLLGKFSVNNNIPVGAGMGASGALCVAIGRWFSAQGRLPQENLLEFSRQLENLFHHESSGGDIAVGIAGEGIYFSRSGGLHPIKAKWQPKWYLSYSGKTSITSRCVDKVKSLWQKNQNLAEKIDLEMAESVALAQKAFQSNEEEGLPLLKKAIKQAESCFRQWQLCEGILAQHIEKLLKTGAIAAKPTGAGDGGYVLSLWNETPPNNLDFELIAI
ncbi:MAG: mevalonate kinase [Gammaproteobacteria bacterium]